jgi:hypothetical protein
MLPQLKKRPARSREARIAAVQQAATNDALDAALAALETSQAEVETTLAKLESQWAMLSARLSASPGAVPELVGVVEIARRLGLTDAKTASALLANYPGFPEPVAQLRMGYIWAWSDVQVWAKARAHTLV